MGVEYIGNMLYDKKILDNGKKIIIFGSGLCGKRVAEYIVKSGGRDSIICFCDSNYGTEKNEIMGIPVLEPSEVCKKYPNADYLISGKYSWQMYDFLKINFINKIHILVI